MFLGNVSHLRCLINFVKFKYQPLDGRRVLRVSMLSMINDQMFSGALVPLF